MYKLSLPATIFMLLFVASCASQEIPEESTSVSGKAEPHRYGGWYCPDNFGFPPVDIQKLDEVPAIAHRLPTEQELQDHKSLMKVDTEKYPDARALDMDLPRLARVNSRHSGINELVIIIQAIVVNQDTVVGYRFANGGNGSARLNEVTLLSETEVAGMGPQPFFYSRDVLNASKEEIWKAITQTEYFKQLGETFNQKEFFNSDWTSASEVHLKLQTDSMKASGYVGTVYGNAYLHIDYDRNGFHYSEKLLMMENPEDKTTELFFACGPFPQNFDQQEVKWDTWFAKVKKASE